MTCSVSYKGWTISPEYIGFAATHDDRFDGESHDWQVNGNTAEEVMELIDEKEAE